MKKLLLFYFSMILIPFVYSQQVPRDQVLLEIGTGTWCYYCPGAALGADDLISNGYDVAVIENHGPIGSDPYATNASVARNSYYGLTGYPTAWFDGGIPVIGGDHTSSLFSSYLPKYNYRKGVESSFTLSMNGFNEGSDYTVIVSTERVASYNGDNLVLHLVLTESDITYSWQGLSDLNFVNRLMVPDQYGTPLDFSSADVVSNELSFTLDPTWVADHCELIAYIQDNDNKEVLQTTKVALNDLMPAYFYNASCMNLGMVPVMNCSGEVSPMVAIQNDGANDLTSLEINYRVNDEMLNTYNWSGNLAFGEMEYVDLPTVSFEMMPDNNLTVYTTMPDGNPDEDPMNDTTYTAFENAAEVIPAVYLFLKLDDYPEETSYELKNSAGTVVYSGGSFTVAGEFVKDTFNLTMDDCYTFYIYDAAGNGLEDGAYYSLRQSNFTMFYENYEFAGAEELVQFSVDMVSVGENQAASAFNVFPNPATDKAYIEFNLDQSINAEIKVYDMIGKVVFNTESQQYPAGRNVVTLDATDLNSGVYFVAVKLGDQTLTKKISIR